MALPVDLACNGVEAVEAVRNRQYDAILMDCQMPEMDGFEATRRIREMERVNLAVDRDTSPVLIVAVTANALKGDRDRCIAAGMDDYISKPLVPDTLVNAIESRLRSGSHMTSASECSEESTMVPDGTDDNASLSPAIAPAFNTEALCQRCLGNVDLIEKVLNQFQADANGLLDQLATLVEANDPGEVAKLAHLLKGMAANLSANELQQAACGLESLAREARLDAGGEVLAQLRSEVEHCLNDIPAVLAKARNN